MRAVIWTDVFQSFIMMVGLVGAAVMGVYKVGSFEKIIDVASKYERLKIE